MKKWFGVRKMDEMELQITLHASQAAWIFLVVAIAIWYIWELTHGGEVTLPSFLLGAEVVIFTLARWSGRARMGDGRVKGEVILWIVLTAALVVFGLLLARFG